MKARGSRKTAKSSLRGARSATRQSSVIRKMDCHVRPSGLPRNDVSTIYDIAIVGGGLNGIAMASAVASRGLKVVLIDQNLLKTRLATRCDGRGIAFAGFSKKILEKYGIWQNFDCSYGTIDKVVVSDGIEPFLLKLDNELVENEALGYLIESDDLLQQLYAYATQHTDLTIIDNSEVVDFVTEPDKVVLTLGGDKKIAAKLLIAADGKNSQIRERLGIEAVSFEYNQSALVFTIKHKKPHHNIAHEHFYKSGPFAILPLKDPHRSSVVWTETTEKAKIFAAMTPDELHYFLQQKCQLTHGAVQVDSKICSYPLSLVFAKKYYDKRVVLIGDSLHFIHPIAGQGFNLSLRDIDQLTDLISEYHGLGLDIGSDTMLGQFASGRKIDNYAMIIFTDILNRSFSNNSKILSVLRKIGLSVIDMRPGLQKMLINYAWTKR